MKIRDQVVAKRFVLADDEGKPVAYLTGRESGIIGLTIAGAGGAAPMVSIGVESDGGPNIVVHGLDERGNTRGAVLISVTEDGRGVIHLEDAGGATRTITTGGVSSASRTLHSPVRADPSPDLPGEAQEGSQRPWWRRMFRQ